MQRSERHIAIVNKFSNAVLFFNEAQKEESTLIENCKKYYTALSKIEVSLEKFPTLKQELLKILRLETFNSKTSQVNVDLMEKISLKVCYINDMLEDISEIQDALLILSLIHI